MSVSHLRAGRARVRFAVAGGAAAVIVVALVVGSVMSRGESEPASVAIGGAAETGALLEGISQEGIVLGSPNAPVTLVEYADLQCPFCAEWGRDTFPVIVADYVRTGDVRLVFRGLAFIGPESEDALRSALAAGRQRKLWNVVELLFENQAGENEGWVTDELLRGIGRAVPGLDAERMLAEQDVSSVNREMRAAERSARAAGIQATPSFALGPTGGKLEVLEVSSLDPSAFRPALDALLGR